MVNFLARIGNDILESPLFAALRPLNRTVPAPLRDGGNTLEALETQNTLASNLEGALGAKPEPVYRKEGYPTIYGGTQEQANQIWNIQSAMPSQDRQAVGSIRVGDQYVTGTFQVTRGGKNYGDIYINSADLNNSDRARYVVLHESGHAVAMQNNTLDGKQGKLWKKGPDIYGDPKENHSGPVDKAAETFADAYAAYYSGGSDRERLRQAAPDQYRVIESGSYRDTSARPGFLDYLGSGINFVGEHLSSLGSTLGRAFGIPQIPLAMNRFLASTGFLLGTGKPPFQNF